MKIKDSGERSQFSTGAQRDCQEGKGRMDLLPLRALREVSKIFEEGAKKYDADNWRKGIPLSRFIDSGKRHLDKWIMGCDDEPHLYQACWNLLCLAETVLMIEEGKLPEELSDLFERKVTDKTVTPDNVVRQATRDSKAWEAMIRDRLREVIADMQKEHNSDSK
jgi:hypothetical protein